jgi:hypothetical protein
MDTTDTTDTSYKWIKKNKKTDRKSGVIYMCRIQKNKKTILNTGRGTLGEAIDLVRTTLLDNPDFFDGMPTWKIRKIKEMYKLPPLVSDVTDVSELTEIIKLTNKQIFDRMTDETKNNIKSLYNIIRLEEERV